jgi:hypothetical protein
MQWSCVVLTVLWWDCRNLHDVHQLCLAGCSLSGVEKILVECMLICHMGWDYCFSCSHCLVCRFGCSKKQLEVVWYPSFGTGILEFILEFHRWAVWLSQNWFIISFRKSSKMTPWVNTIPSWDLSFAILVEAIYKFNIELCCHLQFLW